MRLRSALSIAAGILTIGGAAAQAATLAPTGAPSGALVVSSGLGSAAKVVIGTHAYGLPRFGVTRIQLPAKRTGLVVVSGSQVVGRALTITRDQVTVLAVTPGRTPGLHSATLRPSSVTPEEARLIIVDAAGGGRLAVTGGGRALASGLTPGSVKAVTIPAGSGALTLGAGGPSARYVVARGSQLVLTITGPAGHLTLHAGGFPHLPGVTVSAPVTPTPTPTPTPTAGCGTVTGNDVELTITGSCDTLTLQGGDERVHVQGSVGRLETAGSDGAVTVDGSVTTADLTGSDNQVTVAGNLADLQLPGSNDRATAGTIGQVDATGTNNTAVWHNAPAPTVDDTGQHNSVTQG